MPAYAYRLSRKITLDLGTRAYKHGVCKYLGRERGHEIIHADLNNNCLNE